jgi:SNF2 family DNA or RNA helicase
VWWRSVSDLSPVLVNRTKNADPAAIERSNAKGEALMRKMSKIYIERKKEDVLGDTLPSKNEHVVVCEPSPLQKRIYAHILTLPGKSCLSLLFYLV